MKWTNDQLMAINTRGGKVIVSAAAGSGKTAVLSARILEYILNGGSIDKLLTVTFTTLAAGEMKERIRKNINDELIKNPTNKHLQEQVLLIEQALIMTMDAFYNKLLKENFLTLNINPNFKIIDEIEYKIVKRKVLDRIIENNISNSNFEPLFDNFSNFKTGTTIEELLITFNNHINKIPFPDKWLEAFKKVYDVNFFNESIWSKVLYEEIIEQFQNYEKLYLDLFEEIKLDDVLLEKLEPFLFYELSKIQKIVEIAQRYNYNELKLKINSFKVDRYPSIKGYSNHPISLKFKTIRENIKKNIKNYNSNIFMKDENDFLEDLSNIKNLINILVEITKEFRKELKNEQVKNNFLSFEDVPHLVLQLLVKDYNYNTHEAILNPIAEVIANQFDEILIDEFQDTNLLQDLIFKSISKNNTNLFIVGDAKQSIYGFRSARPDILINEKESATLNDFPRIINLSKNFRSRNDVLLFTNYLFSKTMKKDFGDIIYDESELLNLGASYPINVESYPEIYLLTSDDNENDEALEELNKNEKEAIFVSNKIKQLIDNKYPIYDFKSNQNRPIQPNDIAVLLRSPGEFANNLRDCLIKQGIDVYTDRTPIYFDNYEVKLIIAILKILNNPYDNIALTSVLRSPLFGLSEDLLLEIRLINRDNYLYNNLFKINNNEVINFLKTYNDLKQQSKIMSIDNLINYIYIKTKMIAIISSLKNGSDRVENLLEMVNHASNYNHNNLSSFIDYIDDLIEQEYSLAGNNPAPEKDSVLITTIHQSKGLEFPVVFLPQLEKEFNFKDLNNNILIDNDYYLSFKLRSLREFTINSNLPFELIKIEKRNKQLAEELRVLYVALTRAKEKLILSGTVKNPSSTILKIGSLIGNDETIPTPYLKSSKSFMDWILPVIIKHSKGKELRELANIDTLLYNDHIDFKLSIIDTNNLTIIEENNFIKNYEIDDNKLEEIFHYQYPYSIIKQKSRLSVSELNDYFKSYLKPNFIEDDTAFLVGTTYHKILEHIPFINYDNTSFEIAVNQLLNQNIINNDELSIINQTKIYNFFENELYEKVIVKGDCYKEYPISFIKETNGNEVVIDGIIDLLCIYNNNYYLIDYKSDIVTDENDLIERYQNQLDLYENALKQRGITNIYKYIYSFNFKKFIKLK